MKKNQYGFAALEVAVIIVVLAVLGAVGWYVYQKNKGDDKKTNTSQNSGSEDTKNPDSKDSDDVAQSYVTISEWGIRAPYGGEQKLTLKTYTDGTTRVGFASEQLTALDPACNVGAASGGTIVRFKPTDPAYLDGSTEPTAAEVAKTDSKFKKVGDYYYRFTHSQSGCGDTAKTGALQHEVNDLVESLVPKLEATY